MSAGTTRHTVRVDDALWSAATARAKERGDTISQVIRLALMVYAADEIEDEDEDEDRPFRPGARVEVHEVDGGYMVIPIEEQS